MHGLHDERRPSSRRQVAVIASILGVGAFVTLAGLRSCPGQFSLRGHSFEEQFKDKEMDIFSTEGNESQSHPTLKLDGDSEVGADHDVEAISLQLEDQIVAQVPMEDKVDLSQTPAVEDHAVENKKVQLQRRQDDGANVTSPSSPTDGEQAATTSEPVEPPSTTDPVPETTTVLTTVVTETEQPEEPTTTSLLPVEPTTTTDLPPPGTTSSTPEDPTTTVIPPPETTSIPQPTTTLGTSISSEDPSAESPSLPPTSSEPTSTPSRSSLADSSPPFSSSAVIESVPTSTQELPNTTEDVPTTTEEPGQSTTVTTEVTTSTTFVTSVTSEEEDEPSSTTEESEPTTTKEERTTTEAEVTSSAVEKVVTSTLPNGSKTVVTSTTYVEVVAGGGEPTAEPTDPDLQNVAVGLSAGPVGSLMAAFIATVYLLA